MLRSNAPSKAGQGKKKILSTIESSNISALKVVPKEKVNSKTISEDANNNNKADQDIIVVSSTLQTSTHTTTQTEQENVKEQHTTVQGCFAFFFF